MHMSNPCTVEHLNSMKSSEKYGVFSSLASVDTSCEHSDKGSLLFLLRLALKLVQSCTLCEDRGLQSYVFSNLFSLFFFFLFSKVLCFWEKKHFSYKVVPQKNKCLALENVLHDVNFMKKHVNLFDFFEVNQSKSTQSVSNFVCACGLHVCRCSESTVSCSDLFIPCEKKWSCYIHSGISY